jgi:hypothetical protein
MLTVFLPGLFSGEREWVLQLLHPIFKKLCPLARSLPPMQGNLFDLIVASARNVYGCHYGKSEI